MRSAFEIFADNVLLRGFKMQHMALAVKIKGRSNIIIDNHIQRCDLSGGIWLKEGSRGNIISHNTLILIDGPALIGYLSNGNTFSYNTVVSVSTGVERVC